MTVCFHVFHETCLAGWFKLHDNCPFCRKLLNEQAVEENKEKDITNSYVHRMTHSAGSDGHATQDKLTDADSPHSMSTTIKHSPTNHTSTIFHYKVQMSTDCC